jgi:hypothetical protein
MMGFLTGRIWWFRISMGHEGKWRMIYGPSEHSLPAFSCAIRLLFKDQERIAQVQQFKSTYPKSWLLVPSNEAAK